MINVRINNKKPSSTHSKLIKINVSFRYRKSVGLTNYKNMIIDGFVLHHRQTIVRGFEDW